MKEMLIKSHAVLVDAVDYEWLESFKWSIRYCGDNKSYPYAQTMIEKKTVGMHRLLMRPGKGLLVDHINHNTLDNRRENLRVVTRSQNMWNRKRTAGSSKYKGVCWHKWTEKWNAQISLNDKRIYLGIFDSEEEAALAYNTAAIRLFGEHALINQIGEPV